MAFEMFKQFFRSGKDYFGEKPVVPVFPGSSQIVGDALNTNLGNFERSTELADKTNTFNTEQLRKMLNAAIPGYGSIMKKGSNVVQSYLRGEIPDDVRDAIGKDAAESSMAGGFAGSGMSKNLEARDLGMTSLQLTQQGLDSAMRWISNTRATATPNLVGAESMFISPMDQFAMTQMGFQRDWLQNKIFAAPDPAKRGRADQEMALFSTIMSSIGGFMGGGGGGGGQQQQFQPTTYGSVPMGTTFDSSGNAYAPNQPRRYF